MPDPTYVTNTDQIPPRPVRPSDAKRIEDLCTTSGQISMALAAADILEHHSDPAVRRAIGILQRTCVKPWTDSLGASLTKATTVSEVGVYDLVLDLPDGGQLSIMSSADVLSLHVWISKDAEGWRASLGSPGRGQRISFTLESSVSGESTEHERNQDSYYGNAGIPIAPGDSIHIGSNVIRLHSASCSEGGES